MASAKEDVSFLISFINLVEKNPCLWNYTLKTYSKSEVTGLAWKTIAAELKDTEQNYRERWKNIRCAYVRSLKPPKSGSGTKSKKTYYLAEHLSFLIPYMKGNNMSGNLTVPSAEENDDNNDHFDKLQNDTETENECTDIHDSNFTEEVMSASKTAGEYASVETSQVIEKPPKKRRETPKNDADTAFAEWLQRKNKIKENNGRTRI